MKESIAEPFGPYYLRASGTHGGEVRTLSAVGGDTNTFVSGSYDRQVRLWSSSCDCLREYHFHGDKVSSVVTCHPWENPPSSNVNLPVGPPLIVSGSQDKQILAYNTDGDLLRAFDGHQGNVSCLATYDTGVVSGSWDKKVIIWRRDGSIAHTLTGHSQSVLCICVAMSSDGRQVVFTGSGDKLIICWDIHSGRQLRQYDHHTDSVRCIVDAMEADTFWSCGNDCLIHKFGSDGTIKQTLSGHDSFVYAVAVMQADRLVSASEDRTMRIWDAGQLMQVVYHPNTLWSVIVLGDQSIVTACADGYARVWTSNLEKTAAPSKVSEFTESVSTCEIASEMIPKLSIDQLNDPQQILEGQLGHSVHPDGRREMRCWSRHSQTWTHVGIQRRDSVKGPNARNVAFEGKYYDFVFPIELNGVTLQLPFNTSENPWAVAKAFIGRHSHLGMNASQESEIVQWIIRNANLAETPAIPDLSLSSASLTSPVEKRPGTYTLFTSTSVGQIENRLESMGSSMETRIKEYFSVLESNPLDNGIPNGKIVEDIVKLIRSLPLGCKYPALDLARIYMWHSVGSSRETWSPFFEEIRQVFEAKGQSLDVVVSLRIMANCIAQSEDFPLGDTIRSCIPFMDTKATALRAYTKELILSSDKRIRDGFASLLWNLSVRLQCDRKWLSEVNLDSAGVINMTLSCIGSFLLSEFAVDRKILVLHALAGILSVIDDAQAGDDRGISNNLETKNVKIALESLGHDINAKVRSFAKSLLLHSEKLCF
ncbi:Phospholipase A-2-activating protein [Perkinsela sp. CCAP 1560/4]|nr:Phospholipase A-2-activating protein [Perkinsela sp. CCAP 1560/4]|eukprot:KNH04080.1 Phospholipase A-2-activating protein [Perkinsela sp. CCAP 1560/4]